MLRKQINTGRRFDTVASKMRVESQTASVAHMQQWALSTWKRKNSLINRTPKYFNNYQIFMLYMCNTGLNRVKANLVLNTFCGIYY